MSPKMIGHFVAVGMVIPSLAFAQSYVPVRDFQLENDFAQYLNDFNQYVDTFNDTFVNAGGQGSGNQITTGTSDSIRDLIAGANPGGIASEPCVVDRAGDQIFGPSEANNPTQVADTFWHDADAPAQSSTSTPSPWREAIQYANTRNFDPLPEGFPVPGGTVETDFGASKPQVNSSRSLRCLLQELVEWKKLDLSIQIHQLLKTYISDAQTRQLTNQAQSQVAAANLKFEKQGYVVTSNGVQTKSPLLITNYNDMMYDTLGRRVQMQVAQTMANQGDPVGSLNMGPFAQDAAQQIIADSDGYAVDPFDSSSLLTSYDPTIFDPNEYNDFMQDMTAASDPNGDPVMPGVGFTNLLNSPQNTRLGAMDLSTQIAYQRANDAMAQQERKSKGEDTLPTEQSLDDQSVNPYDDPYFRQTVSPTAQNTDALLAPSRNTYQQLAGANSADAVPATSTQEANTLINSSEGALNYEVDNLANTPNAVHDIVKELYDTIWFGYFDLHPYTSEWAQATMLMIYDEMKFNQYRPGIVTTNAPAAQDDPMNTDPSESPPGF